MLFHPALDGGAKHAALMKKLHSIDLEEVRRCLVYDPNSPSGLRWAKPRCKSVNPGGVAGTLQSSGYWRLMIKGRMAQTHHVVLLLHDCWPAFHQYEVDHIDRNTSNNSIDNLRWTNRSENCRNRRHSGKSPYRYVSWFSRSGKWMAKWRLANQGRFMFAGYFEDEYEAHCAAVAHKNKTLGTNELPQHPQP